MRCTFAEASPGRSTNLEAPRCHGQEVRPRPAIDRIVSDKTFWNATISRNFFKKNSKVTNPSKIAPSNILKQLRSTHILRQPATGIASSYFLIYIHSHCFRFFAKNSWAMLLSCYLRSTLRRRLRVRRSLPCKLLGRGPTGRTPHC